MKNTATTRRFPAYTLADLKAFVAAGDMPHEKTEEIKAEIARREAGTSKNLMAAIDGTGVQVSGLPTAADVTKKAKELHRIAAAAFREKTGRESPSPFTELSITQRAVYRALARHFLTKTTP